MTILTRWSVTLLCCGVTAASAGCGGWRWLDEDLTTCRGRCPPLPAGADAGGGDRAPAPTSWGSYAAGVSLPECPASANAPLVVDTVADELDGGETLADPSQAGARLSLPEALWIAYNRPGQDRIGFDPVLFAPERGTQVILRCGPELPLPGLLEDVCIDGRGADVSVRWAPTSMAVIGRCAWNLGRGALQVGLSLVDTVYEQSLSAGATVAGCRFWHLQRWALETNGAAIIGPANAFLDAEGSTAQGIRIMGDGATVAGNDFGLDPSTNQPHPVSSAVDLRAAATLSGNLFAVWGTALLVNQVPDAALVVLRDNRFGVDRGGQLLQGPETGLVLSAGRFELGPGDVFRGARGAAISIREAAVKVTRCSISGNGAGIVYLDAAPVQAPSVDAVTAQEVRGACSAPGDVELYADPEDQGEIFLAATPCDPATGWRTPRPVYPTGYRLTATLTDPSGRTSAFSAPY